MKKVFLTLALAAFAFAANAQFVVSGNLGFNRTGEKDFADGDQVYTASPQKTTNFNLSLRGGYMINEKLTVGLDFGFGMNTIKTETALAAEPTKVNTTTWDKSPSLNFDVFARYYCFELGKFNFFAEGSLGMSILQRNKVHTEVETPSSTTDQVNIKRNTLFVAFVPGVNYAFNEHWSMDIYFDFMGFGFRHNKWSYAEVDPTTGLATDKYDSKNYETDNNLYLNIANGTITGNGILNNIRFGVNYAF